MPRRPKLGQHFLTDQSVLERIAKAAASAGDTVIEIGPGRGALTVQLVCIARRVVAVELDRVLAAALPAECGHPSNLEVVQGDVLNLDLKELLRGPGCQESVVAGNLPYYITSPILRAVFAASDSFRCATFLIQEEVANRTVARPGGKSFGYLSCLCQLFSCPTKLFDVPAGAFSPQPKVSSAVVRFTMRPTVPPNGLLEFLRRCFRNPRKTLRNNLSGSYPPDRINVDPSAGFRAQQLSVEELAAMWRRLQS